MKIITKLGVITLLVPLATFGCKDAKLVTDENLNNIDEQPIILLEKQEKNSEILPYGFEKIWHISKDKIEQKTSSENIVEEPVVEEFKINILEDNYNQNEFAVHSNGFVPSEELQNKFANIINNRKKDFSFYVISVDEKISFGFNPEQKNSCASSIKAPYSLFCYKQLEKGVSSFDEIKQYNSSFYCGGSGIIQYSNRTDYTIRELLYNTIHYSDNIAYGMIFDHFGSEGYNEMIESLGCSHLKLTPYSEWGSATPKEMVTVWQEIYRYKDTEYGKIFFDDLLNAEYNFIKNNLTNKDIACKSGYNSGNYNAHGVVFNDNVPYIISIMIPNPNSYDNHGYLLGQIATLSDELMNEYKVYLEKEKTNQKVKELQSNNY